MDLTRFENCKAHTRGIYISNDPEPYKPCCWFQTGVMTDSWKDYNEKLKGLDIAKNCEYCIKMEEGGGEWSPRLIFENFAHERRFIINASLGNLCNLKCVTCSPFNSTQVAAELPNDYKYLNMFDKKYFNRITNQVQEKIRVIRQILTEVEIDELQFELLGGEPLINPEIFELIDWIVEQPFAPKMSINITTNSTTFDERLIGYAKKIAMLTVQLSVDGVGETFEYLRYNATYENLEVVADKFYNLSKELHNFHLSFNYTLSWMNSLHVPNFLNWVQTRYPDTWIHITKLVGPPEYGVDLLSYEMREKIYNEGSSKLIPAINDKFQHAYNLYNQHMLSKNTESFNIARYIYGLNALAFNDFKRNENFRQVFAEILSFIDDNLTDGQKQAINAGLKNYDPVTTS